MERKKIGQIQGRISGRRLVCNPTIQHVIINLYTKYDSSSLQGCGEIFDEIVLRNYGRTDGRTDGMTDRCKPVYPPLFQSGGIISLRNRLSPERLDDLVTVSCEGGALSDFYFKSALQHWKKRKKEGQKNILIKLL